MVNMASFGIAIALACSQRPTGPLVACADRGGDTIPPAAVTLKGEATLEVDIRSGGASAVVHTSSMSGAIVPVADTNAEVVGDSVVRIYVALHNPGSLRVYEPAALAAPSADFSVISGPAERGQLFRISNSAIGSGAISPFSFNSLLPLTAINPAGRHYVAPGGASRGDTVIVTVPHGVRAFRFTLQASGTRVYTIGSEAPIGSADSVLASAATRAFTNHEFPFRVARDRLWLVFKPGASLDERQEALDVVDGKVIGGQILGAPNDYYVQLPPRRDTGTGPLLHAIHLLAALPQVRFANLDVLDQLSTK